MPEKESSSIEDLINRKQELIKAARLESEELTENTQNFHKDESKYLLEHAKEEAAIEGIRQDIKERKKYASHLFYLIAVWLVMLLFIIIYHGIADNGFSLSEPVLITLITTTTANVAAFFLVVTKYLFPSSKKL